MATRMERVPAGKKPNALTVRQLCAISKHHRL